MKRWSCILMLAAAAWAQQPQIENARLENRAFSGSLRAEVSQFGAGPFWMGYSEPIVSGRRGDMCRNNGRDDSGFAVGSPVRLEGPTALIVLARVENGQVTEIRVSSPDCRLDAGGLAFYWVNNVPAEESVAWLKSMVAERHTDQVVLAIALHGGPAAERALNDFTAQDQPQRVREKTAFWLGTTRGASGVQTLKRMLASDPNPKVREQVIFSLSLSKDPAGLATVIDAAHNDKDPHVRGQALFWLAQKAGNKQAADVIRGAVSNDPDRAVKERAVFALKQLPGDQGIPLLIDVAKNNPDPSVRKKAIFWLGQSGDPRALEFFSDVLKK